MLPSGCNGLGREAGERERKRGNATDVRTLFLARQSLVLFSSLKLAAIFCKLDRLQKKESFSLFNYSSRSLVPKRPSSQTQRPHCLLWARTRTKKSAQPPELNLNVSHKHMTRARH